MAKDLVMAKDGQGMALWSGQGIGKFTGPGKVSYRGAVYFRKTDSLPKLKIMLFLSQVCFCLPYSFEPDLSRTSILYYYRVA